MSFLPLCCDCRKDDDLAERRRRLDPTRGVPRICGLGITFREDFNGGLHVHQLLEGGAGWNSGQIQVSSCSRAACPPRARPARNRA